MYRAGYYDVIVVGAGHAGCEAAFASARLGCKTLVITLNLDSIAMMPCNPNIGGTAKGHLVREIDALGGQMGVNIDKTFIQSRMINTSKGPAVHSLRAQADKKAYQAEMKHAMELKENLTIKQDEVIAIDVIDGKLRGITTRNGACFECKCAVLTTGTYLKGRIIIGEVNYSGGPNGLFPANELSSSLIQNGISLRRFKTGTPSRLNRRTIDFSKMKVQPGDDVIIPFSFMSGELSCDQVPCYLTYTNERTKDVILRNIDRSPLYNGTIKSIGPRYCPSFEDKIMKFPDKERHQLFIEPEGENTEEVYVQGMSSSLPEEVQIEFLRTIEGLENCEVLRTGYAIEYDCIDPLQLKPSLELLSLDGLFFAGQINGSSGYEEAAAQGLMAGINAALKIKGKPSFVLNRAEAYIGVLIDDLVTKGTNEPYRMMTSRAEYRLLLRQDNADLRLTQKGYDIGLVNKERYERFIERKKMIEDEINRVKKVIIPPAEENNKVLESLKSTPIKSGVYLNELLKRPEITYSEIICVDKSHPQLRPDIIEEVQTEIKYEGYIKKQFEQVEQFKKLEEKRIPQEINFNDINGLRIEAKQKLSKIRPESIGQASRISGVSPADISVLLIYLEMRKRSTGELKNE